MDHVVDDYDIEDNMMISPPIYATAWVWTFYDNDDGDGVDDYDDVDENGDDDGDDVDENGDDDVATYMQRPVSAHCRSTLLPMAQGSLQLPNLFERRLIWESRDMRWM